MYSFDSSTCVPEAVGGPPGKHTTMRDEGFYPLDNDNWTRSTRATLVKPRVGGSGLLVVDDADGELFRPASNTGNEFVRLTHEAVRKWSQESGATPGERHYRAVVAGIEKRYIAYADETHFAAGESAPNY